ncbi:MAG: hypothetical protein AAGL34_13135 [Bacteroidota bacterium]
MKSIFFTGLWLFGTLALQAQDLISKPSYFKTELDSLLETQIVVSLDSLFHDMSDFKLSTKYLKEEESELTKAVLNRYFVSPIRRKRTFFKDYSFKLINLYETKKNNYFLTVVVTKLKSNEVHHIIDLLATPINQKIVFFTPIKHHAQFWKNHTVGNITYHFRDTINLLNAEEFDRKNTVISQKLGLTPDSFDFYMCYNEQEVLNLLGIQFLSDRVGLTRNGFGVYTKTICAIENHEDFSHDVFHYYSGKVNQPQDRNWITEEGVAYLWGNAYYTDTNGEMISLTRLVSELNTYLDSHPDANLFELFERNTKIFSHIAPEISVRSTIAGVLAHEIENKKGQEGINTLINAGSKNRLETFLTATEHLIGVNKHNFNTRVKKLLKRYPTEE